MDRKDLHEGDTLYVVRPGRRTGRATATLDNPIAVTVTNVARVWVDLTAVEDHGRPHARQWRMRIDEQHDGGELWSWRYHFYTAEQLERLKVERDAAATLLAHGVDIRLQSPWRRHQVVLAAAVLAAAESLPEEDRAKLAAP